MKTPPVPESTVAAYNWNVDVSKLISAAVLQTANYIDATRRPLFIQTIETLHLRFSRHQLAHPSSFPLLMETLCPVDPQTRVHRVDEWLELTVCFHALLDPDETEYLNKRIMEALSVYYMGHEHDLLLQLHGDFQVDPDEFANWVSKVAWYRVACAVILFWLPNDFQEVSGTMRTTVVEQRGG